eukprot:5843351-Pleurochrysis_carterae.AAC.4
MGAPIPDAASPDAASPEASSVERDAALRLTRSDTSTVAVTTHGGEAAAWLIQPGAKSPGPENVRRTQPAARARARLTLRWITRCRACTFVPSPVGGHMTEGQRAARNERSAVQKIRKRSVTCKRQLRGTEHSAAESTTTIPLLAARTALSETSLAVRTPPTKLLPDLRA